MVVQDNKSYKVVEKVKTTELVVHEVEKDAVIVNVNGWRMRVYLDEGFKGTIGQDATIKVDYFGDIKDPHSIRFVKIK